MTAGIKIEGIVYGRLRSPDLDQAEIFLTDFGLARVERTATALYMRGTGANHHVHITELGEPRYVSLGWQAQDGDDLKRLAALPGATGVEHLDEPGGGERVRLTDPDGRLVEVVAGQSRHEPVQLERPDNNRGGRQPCRQGALFRIARGAAAAQRLGHVAVVTPDVERYTAWYRATFGLLCSDRVYRDNRDNIVGSFNRIDRGSDYVDHHILYAMRGPKGGLNHLAFEVHDVDDVLVGHEHLHSKGYRSTWGVGRHALGSQVFDYWFDPWGRVHEHWTDTDLLNSETPTGIGEAGIYTKGPWGPYPPTNGFAGHVSE